MRGGRDNIGALLRGTKRRTWSGGRCWRSLCRSRRTKNFRAEVYVLKKEDGGAAHAIFKAIGRSFYFRTTT